MKYEAESIECNVVHHCTNRCVGCNHLSPMNKAKMVSPDELHKDLTVLAQTFHAKQFVVIGGEPLLHPDMESIVSVARKSGVAERMVLATNAYYLEIQPEKIIKLFDCIDISRYPNSRVSENSYDLAEVRAKDLGIQTRVFWMNRFILPIRREPISENRLMENFQLCKHKDFCHTVQNGFLYRCPQSWQIPSKVMRLKQETDGLDLNGAGVEEVRAYLTNPQPMVSCSRCWHSNSKGVTSVPWREGDRETWLEDSSI